MNEEFVYKNYLLSSRELMVLSAYAGMEQLHIISENPQKQMSRKELDLIIFGLYQKEFLCWKGENSYELNPEIQSIFQAIKDSRKELQIYYGNGENPYLCYWGESIVIMELSENDRDTIKIRSIRSLDFLKDLADRGILLMVNSNQIGKFDGNDFLKKSPDILRAGEIQEIELQRLLRKRADLRAYMNVYERETSQKQGSLLIIDSGISDGLIYLQPGTVRTDWYTPENLERFLLLQ